jgi:hypothetical protein
MYALRDTAGRWYSEYTTEQGEQFRTWLASPTYIRRFRTRPEAVAAARESGLAWAVESLTLPKTPRVRLVVLD